MTEKTMNRELPKISEGPQFSKFQIPLIIL